MGSFMTTLSRMMYCCLYVLCLCCVLVSTVEAQTSMEEGEGGREPAVIVQEKVRSFYDLLLTVMKEGEGLSFEERVLRLDPVVRGLFDLPRMTARMMSFLWRRHTIEERRLLVELFSTFTVYNYAYNFRRFDGEGFRVLGTAPGYGGSIFVKTELLTPRQPDPIQIHYLMQYTRHQWRVVDVYLQGTISELATRRSQFYAVYKQGRLEGLIEKFRTLIANLKAEGD